jgi:hypothetical protein
MNPMAGRENGLLHFDLVRSLAGVFIGQQVRAKLLAEAFPGRFLIAIIFLRALSRRQRDPVHLA